MCLHAASGAQGGATPRSSSSFITADRHRPPARLQAAAWTPEPGLFPLNTAGPVRAAVRTEADDHAEDDEGEGGVRVELRGGNEPQTESVRGAGASRSDAAEKSPLFGCAAD